MPAGAGTLSPSELNGISGRTLDELVLEPLKLDRSDVRVIDIRNRYMANDSQREALARSYEPFVQQGILPEVHWTSRKTIISIPTDREPSLRAEFDEAGPDWVITLGNEPLRVLGFPSLSAEGYGTSRSAKVLGNDVVLLPLVHTRQAGKHGQHSTEWNEAHGSWISDGAHECAIQIAER